MKIQGLLPHFPTHVFATSKRKKKAEIRRARKEFSLISINGYAELFSDILPLETLAKFDPTIRLRMYGFIAVFWAWIAQIFTGNKSCSFAVSLVQAWNTRRKLPVPSNDTSAYCQARKKVNPTILQKTDNHIQLYLSQRVSDKDLWKGHELLAIDGTSVRLMDTEANQKSFPQPVGQKKDCGFPVMGVVGMVNLSHGGIVGVATCGHQKHDARIAPQLLHTIEEGNVVLADRAFCSYEYISRVTNDKKAHIVMRLHPARHAKLDWRKGKKLSKFEMTRHLGKTFYTKCYKRFNS